MKLQSFFVLLLYLNVLPVKCRFVFDKNSEVDKIIITFERGTEFPIYETTSEINKQTNSNTDISEAVEIDKTPIQNTENNPQLCYYENCLIQPEIRKPFELTSDVEIISGNAV